MSREVMGREVLLALALLWGFATAVAAQRPAIEAFDVGDGLPAAEIFDIASGPRGRLWILSRAGLVSYDGHRFVTAPLPEAGHAVAVGAIDIDARGRLWVIIHSLRASLVAYREGDGWRRLPEAPALPMTLDATTSLAVAGELVVASSPEGGAVAWTGAAWARVEALAEEPFYVQSAIAVDDAVLLGTRSGLCRIPASGPPCVPVGGDPRLGDEIVALDHERRGRGPRGPAPARLWILSRRWMGYLEEGRLVVVAEGFGRSLAYRGAILADGLGGAWFGDDNEVFYVHPGDGGPLRLTRGEGLAGDGLTTLARDREGHVWIGGLRGLSRVRGQRFLTYDQEQGLLEDEVSAIAEPEPGRLLFGHNGGWTILDRNGDPRTLPFPSPLGGPPNSYRVLDMAVDAEGVAWAAAAELGLVRLAPAEGFWRRIEMPAERIFSVELDTRGRLWVNSTQELFVRRGARFARVRPRVHLTASTTFRWLTAAADGRLFLSTVNGVVVRDDGGWTHALGPDPAANNVYGVRVSRSGEVWVGTRGGLHELRDGRLEKVERGALEVDRAIYFVFEDGRDRLWLGTDDGVYRWDGEHLRHYTVRHGLPGRETNRGAGFVDHRGRVWIGTDRGVALYQEHHDVGPAAAPHVELRALEVDGTPWDAGGGDVRLSHHQNALTFRADAVYFSREQDVLYRYRLDGLDARWRGPEPLESPSFRYPGLPPGRYRFRIAAGWPDGPWSPEVTSPAIFIAPPPWRQPWFLLLAAAAVVLSVVGVHRLRLQAVRSKNVELEEINARLEASIADRQRLIGELEGRNAELERFTYTVSHDLKSPLVTVRGFLGLLTRDAEAGDVERLREDVAHIDAAAAKMARLLDELLSLSRVGRVADPSGEVDLGEIVVQALELLAGPIAAAGVEVDVRPGLPVVHGDRVRLLEVFQNLVDNAVKYMGNQPAPRIEIGLRRGPEPVVYVRDNGSGIDPAFHHKVFGLFERLHHGTEGTGVGLALVKRIVEVHGGRIWVESDGPGHGATFCLTLPDRDGF